MDISTGYDPNVVFDNYGSKSPVSPVPDSKDTTPQANTKPSYNPDEVVSLTHAKTNEVLNVKRADLPKYGLDPSFQPNSQRYAEDIMAGRLDYNNGSVIPQNLRPAVSEVLKRNNWVPQTAEEKRNIALAERGPKKVVTNEGFKLPMLPAIGKQEKWQYADPATGQFQMADTAQEATDQLNQKLSVAGSKKQLPNIGPPPDNKNPQDNTKEKANWNIVENAMNDAIGIGKSLPNIALQSNPAYMFAHALLNPQVAQNERTQMAMGTIKDLGQFTGISTNDQGGVHFDPRAAATHILNHPLGAAMWFATFWDAAGLLKGESTGALKGDTGVAGELRPIERARDIGPVQGRMLTAAATPNPESVSASEALMKDAYDTTTAGTTRGVAKQLEQFSVDTGQHIKDYLSKVDKSATPIPHDDAVNAILKKVTNSDVGSTQVDSLPQIKDFINKNLPDKVYPSDFNQLRIEANKDLDSWFRNEKPTTTATDVKRALKWEVSNATKDTILSAMPDKTDEYLTKALNLQHSAMQSAPVLSKQALSTTAGGIGGPMRMMRSILSPILDPIKVALGRSAAGPATDLVKSIRKGQLPDLPEGPTSLIPSHTTLQNTSQMPSITGQASPGALPNEGYPINSTKTVMGSSLPGRSLIDKRYKIGNVPKK